MSVRISYIYIFICVYIYIYLCIYIYVYIYIYIQMYIIYMYQYILNHIISYMEHHVVLDKTGQRVGTASSNGRWSATIPFTGARIANLRCRWITWIACQKKNLRWFIGWLVVGPPLWKIWTSIGMMRFPIYGNIKHVPNHQPVGIFRRLEWFFYRKNMKKDYTHPGLTYY